MFTRMTFSGIQWICTRLGLISIPPRKADPTIWLQEEENDSDVKHTSTKTIIIQQCLARHIVLKATTRERIVLSEAVSEMNISGLGCLAMKNIAL
uniref:Uncharacterized protein n=1 Tax=Oryza glumipatula TaxID=40148 RepID=A0A0D9Y3C5_9ORYZ